MERVVKSIQWGKGIVKAITIYPSLESTNAFARSYPKSGGASGTVLWALQQTKGKGRRGRVWQSDQGSLTFSLLWKCEEDMVPHNLTLAVGLGLVQMLRKLVPDLKVKWPNDLYVGKDKLGGILAEGIHNQGKLWIIMGIGLNVNSAPKQKKGSAGSTSFLEATGKLWSRLAILDQALLGIERGFELARRREDLTSLFRIHGNFLDRPITIRQGDFVFEAIARGVLADGRLLIEDARGERALLPEEISVLFS